MEREEYRAGIRRDKDGYPISVVLGSIKAVFTSVHPWIALTFFAVPSCAFFVWAQEILERVSE